MINTVEIPVVFGGPSIKADDTDLCKFGFPGLAKKLFKDLFSICSNTALFTMDLKMRFESDTLSFSWSKDELFKRGYYISALAANFTKTIDDLNLGVDFEVMTELENGNITLKIKFPYLLMSEKEALLGLLRIKGLTLTVKELKEWSARILGFGNMTYGFTGCTNLKNISFPVNLHNTV